MLTVADMGEGGVKNHGYSADVLYGRSHRLKPTVFEKCIVCVQILWNAI